MNELLTGMNNGAESAAMGVLQSFNWTASIKGRIQGGNK